MKILRARRTKSVQTYKWKLNEEYDFDRQRKSSHATRATEYYGEIYHRKGERKILRISK